MGCVVGLRRAVFANENVLTMSHIWVIFELWLIYCCGIIGWLGFSKPGNPVLS